MSNSPRPVGCCHGRMRPWASGRMSLVLGVRLIVGGSERGQRLTHQGAGTLQQVCLLIHQPGELAKDLRCRPKRGRVRAERARRLIDGDPARRATAGRHARRARAQTQADAVAPVRATRLGAAALAPDRSPLRPDQTPAKRPPRPGRGSSAATPSADRRNKPSSVTSVGHSPPDREAGPICATARRDAKHRPNLCENMNARRFHHPRSGQRARTSRLTADTGPRRFCVVSRAALVHQARMLASLGINVVRFRALPAHGRARPQRGRSPLLTRLGLPRSDLRTHAQGRASD